MPLNIGIRIWRRTITEYSVVVTLRRSLLPLSVAVRAKQLIRASLFQPCASSFRKKAWYTEHAEQSHGLAISCFGGARMNHAGVKTFRVASRRVPTACLSIVSFRGSLETSLATGIPVMDGGRHSAIAVLSMSATVRLSSRKKEFACNTAEDGRVSASQRVYFQQQQIAGTGYRYQHQYQRQYQYEYMCSHFYLPLAVGLLDGRTQFIVSRRPRSGCSASQDARILLRKIAGRSTLATRTQSTIDKPKPRRVDLGLRLPTADPFHDERAPYVSVHLHVRFDDASRT